MTSPSRLNTALFRTRICIQYDDKSIVTCNFIIVHKYFNDTTAICLPVRVARNIALDIPYMSYNVFDIS